MRRTIKCAFLCVLWAMGLFALARRRTRAGLRILCIHGGSIRDEHVFMPNLFMRRETFRRRLQYLARARYPVLPLGEALARLADGTLPDCATVITIDDGFFSTFRDFPGPLREFGFPATLYVTTYHIEKGSPIFRLVLQYMLWKTDKVELDCSGLEAGVEGVRPIRTDAEKRRLCWEIIDHAEARETDERRCELARELGKRLGVDFDEIAERRYFNISTREEVREMARAGIDIQLHTHRHRLPADRESVAREIADNKAFLEELCDRPLEHFCYPSGDWVEEHGPWLREVGVLSATTCDAGLNYAPAPSYALLRLLDRDDATTIEFAAEMCGLSQALREVRARLVSPRTRQ